MVLGGIEIGERHIRPDWDDRHEWMELDVLLDTT
jgi:hypothetical protein